MPKAFVTGSYAYGRVNDNSDLDLVIAVSRETLEILRAECDEQTSIKHGSDGGAERGSFRFGKLNLICVTTKEQYECWKEGTQQLIEEKPVSRERAVEHFRKLREEYGVT